MLPARTCKSSPASLSCTPEAQHTGQRSTAFLSLVMVVVMAHGATTMTNDMNAVFLQKAGMSHLKDCTHYQLCVSVMAGLSSLFNPEMSNSIQKRHPYTGSLNRETFGDSEILCMCQLPFAPCAWDHACFLHREREHVITSAIK